DHDVGGDAGCEPRAQALPGGTPERQPDGILGQSRVSQAPHPLARQHGAGGAIPVANAELVLNPLLALQRRHGERDQLVIEHLVEAMVLPLAVVDGDALRHLGLMKQLPEIEAARLPVADRALRIEALGLADHLIEGAITEGGHDFARLLGNEEEEVDDVLWLSLEPRAQHGILRGDADGTRVEMALAHHDAAKGY